MISSFVLRFVQDADQKELDPLWHGIIHHVQSNTERRFTDLGDALEFIQAYLAEATISGEE